jgi:hypothetical protein
MQFGGSVLSCAFLNDRGDLLVGLPDQVALVRFQDYLPPFVLEDILAQDFWVDDVEESAKDFDANIDVWGISSQDPVIRVVETEVSISR